MRRRGYAVHASNFDEYKSISIEKVANPNSCSSSPYAKPAGPVDNQQAQAVQQSRKLEREMKKADPNLWNDFDFKRKTEEQEAHEASDASTADAESPMLRSSGEFGGKFPTNVASFMVIGSQETQIPQLLNSVFQEDPAKLFTVNPAFDLIIKNHEIQGQAYKLKFWIQDPTSARNQDIIQTYYTSNRTYLFVYKSNDRKSFDCLARTIEQIRVKLAGGSFAGLLICDNTGIEEGDHKVVSDEEAEDLKNNYGLISRIETKNPSVELTQEISKFLIPGQDGKGHVYLSLNA